MVMPCRTFWKPSSERPTEVALNVGQASDNQGGSILWTAQERVGGDQQSYSVNLEKESGAIAHLADMDSDGFSDLVYTAGPATYYFANENVVKWGDRRRMDTSGSSPPSPFGEQNVKTADIDFNKHIDIIKSIPAGNGARYQIWFNLGDGTYSNRQLASPPRGFMLSDPGVHIADINGDRVPDIAPGQTNRY